MLLRSRTFFYRFSSHAREARVLLVSYAAVIRVDAQSFSPLMAVGWGGGGGGGRALTTYFSVGIVLLYKKDEVKTKFRQKMCTFRVFCNVDV